MIEQSPPKGLSRRVYVVDDDEGFRSSVVALLESAAWDPESFGSAEEFAERSATLEPGILLLDVHLGGASGLDLIETARQDLERFAVVVVTGAGEIASAVRAMRAGAADFIEKQFEPDALLDRLEQIHHDFAPSLDARTARIEARNRVASLSGRERDVLERLLGGASNKLIARSLGLSPRTVEMHRARMLAKLGVATTAQALEIGRAAGVKGIGEAPRAA